MSEGGFGEPVEFDEPVEYGEPVESGEPFESMTAEEESLAVRLADDLSRVLRTGVIVEDLELDHGDPVRIHVVCLIEGTVREIDAVGSDVATAMGEIVQTAARLRLDAAWWQIVGPA